jgi:hypothetical protein
MTPVGPKEVKFEIKAQTIEEAFSKYYKLADEAVGELEKRIRSAMEEQKKRESKIETVPAAALDLLKDHEPKKGSNIIV